MQRFPLAALVLALAPFAAAQSPAPELADAVRPFVERGTVAGAVMLVAGKEKVLTVEAVGYADVGAKVPLKPDALFWIASQSKTVTAAAVMILVDEGKVALDDPVSKYLPEFTDLWFAAEKDKQHVLLKRPSRGPTIRDCLSHMSGMPFASPVEKPTLDALPLKAAVKGYAATPLESEPGTKYQYSNAGINTAARVVEVVTGMPFEEFLDRRLFAPLGMTDTTFWPSEAQVKRLAKPYGTDKEKKELKETTISQLQYPLTDKRNRYPMPAGGLFSTAADVATFCRMLLNGGMHGDQRILSEASVTAMATRQTPAAVKESYGLGASVGGDGSFGHGGALATNMTVDPKRGRVFVWLVQSAGFPGDGGQAQGAFKKAAEARLAAVR